MQFHMVWKTLKNNKIKKNKCNQNNIDNNPEQIKNTHSTQANSHDHKNCK